MCSAHTFSLKINLGCNYRQDQGDPAIRLVHCLFLKAGTFPPNIFDQILTINQIGTYSPTSIFPILLFYLLYKIYQPFMKF